MARKSKEIPIHCSYSQMVPLGQLRPNPKNPNQHPEEQITKLAKIIQGQGWRHPITVSNRSGLIVSGHCRLYAAQLLGVKSVPVDFQDFASDSEEKACLLADNKIAELAETDSGKMSDIIRELVGADYDLELACVDVDELEPVSLDYSEEKLQPYSRTHILLSFEPSLLMKIQPHLEKILAEGEIEIEQSSN